MKWSGYALIALTLFVMYKAFYNPTPGDLIDRTIENAMSGPPRLID